MPTLRRPWYPVMVLGIGVVLTWPVNGLGVEQQDLDGSTSKSQTPTVRDMTLAEIAAIANGFDRNAALYAFIADADRRRIERLLAEVPVLPATPYRSDISRVLYIRFASLDPAAATDHAVRHLATPEVLSAVLRAWAHGDLGAAVERAIELPTGARADAAAAILQLDLPVAERESIAERLGVRVDVAEVSKPAVPTHGEAYDEMLAELGAIADRRSRLEAEAMISTGWAASEPARALAAILDWDGDAGLKGSMLYRVMDTWAKADPRTAMDWLLAHDSEELPVLAFPVFSALASVDPADAESLVVALPSEAAKRQARIGVLAAILEQGDLDRAVSAFANLDVRDQPAASGELGSLLARADPERALEWVLGLRGQVRNDTFDWTLGVIHRQDPALARQLVQGIADPQMRIQGARTVIGEWPADPIETLAWVETLGSERQYAPVLADVFRAWFRRDGDGAGAALMRYRSGPARDHALRRAVSVHLSAFDTGAAERFFEAIESLQERRMAAARLHRYYTETDPNERKAAVFGALAAEDD